MIEIRIQGDDAKSVMKDLRELGGAEEKLTVQLTPHLAEVSKKLKKETAPAETAAPKESKEEKSPTAPAEAAPTLDTIKQLVPKLMDKLGKPGLIEFLATFGGAKKGSEVPEKDYPEFVKKAQEALA